MYSPLAFLLLLPNASALFLYSENCCSTSQSTLCIHIVATDLVYLPSVSLTIGIPTASFLFNIEPGTLCWILTTDHSFLIETGLVNLTSPTFLESSFSTNAASTENLSPASNLSAGTPAVLPPASSTLYTALVPSILGSPSILN